MSEAGAPVTSIRFEPHRTVLPCGLTLLHQHNPVSPAVSMSLSVAAGAAFEDDATAGLASFAAATLERGTERRDKDEIGEVLDFTGAGLGSGAGRHLGFLKAKCRTADFEEIVALLAECATRPSFPEREVEKLRGDILTDIREDADNPRQVATRELRRLLYPEGHPYGRRVSGTEETVSSLERDDLAAFWARHFAPDRGALVVVGAVDAERVERAVGEAFDGWRGGEAGAGGLHGALPDIADVPGPSSVERVVETMPAKMQTDIALGHPGIRRSDPDYYAAAVMNMVLGRFAMGGRLGRSVREEQGMAYYTFSILEAGIGPGPFMVRAGVDARNVDRAVESIVAEIRRLQDETVGDVELADAKSALVRSVPRTLETNAGMAAALQLIEQYDLGLDYLERYPELIGAVDAAAVQRAARRILRPDRYGLAVAGPYPPAAEEAAAPAPGGS